MTTVAISYKSLISASGEAKAVAKKFDQYADTLESQVYKKLNKYDGDWTANLSNARKNTRAKINELQTEAKDYKDYATDLRDLCDECKVVDRAVKKRVFSLTTSFKERNNIRNSKVENAISYFLVSGCNQTSVGRWIGSKRNQVKEYGTYLKDSIKEWYGYKGGKELIKGVAGALLSIAIGVIGCLTGTTLFAVIAGVIAMAAGVANLLNEGIAYCLTKDMDDPATARRRSKIDSMQDWLRTSDNKNLHLLAGGIDVINLICILGSFLHSGKSLLKKHASWSNGGIKDSIFRQIRDAKKGGYLNETLLEIEGEFFKQLHNRFLGGDLKSVKNVLSFSKDILTDGLNFKTIFKNVTIMMPIVSMNMGEHPILLDDIYDLFDSYDSFVKNDLLTDESNFSYDIITKLESACDVNIAVPEIKIPEFNLSILRTA